MSGDDENVDVIFKTLKVPGAKGGSYGLSFRGSYPVMLADVDPGSPADEGGLKRGDFLVLLNGNDIQRSSEEAVKTILKYSQGSQLTVRIARPHPFPSTDYLRRRAIITLQTKLAAGVADTNDDAVSYKKTVESAFLEVQDILGSLGLGEDDDLLPPSGRGKGQGYQEVEVSYHGNENTLESPPESDKDPFDVLDPLLDFGLDDDLTISKGTGGGASAGADLLKSTFEVQRALKGMKQLTDDINTAKEQKRLARLEAAGQEANRVTTEATFTPSYQCSYPQRNQHPSASHTQHPPVSSSRPPQKVDVPPATTSLYSTVSAPPPMNGVRERADVQWQSSALYTEIGQKSHDRQATSFRESEEVPYNSKRGGHQKAPPEVPPPYGRGQVKLTKYNVDESVPPPVPQYRPREESRPPFVLTSSSPPPLPADGEDPYAPPPVPSYNPAGPEEFLLSNKPEYRQEWKKMTNTYESVGDRDSSPSPPSTYEVVRERGPRSQSPLPYEMFRDKSSNPTSSVPQGRERDSDGVGRSSTSETVLQPTYETVRGERYSNGQPSLLQPYPYPGGGGGGGVRELERSTSPPPPVPVRQHHSLSKTFSAPPPKSPAANAVAQSKDKYKDISLSNVPLRSKKRGGNQSSGSTAQEPTPVGHVEQGHGGRKKYDVNSTVSSIQAPVTDVSDILTACAGLPNNVHQWKKEDVGVWLRQMSPTLYDRYSSLFSKHDVTGRTLLRLNATKLQTLGVTTPAHCRILATEIMRVRIHQEANELRAFKR